MEKANEGCACQADLKKEVEEIVDQVDGYTKEVRQQKKAEVEAAFRKNDDKENK